MQRSDVRALILDAASRSRRVIVVGFGKGAAAMACGLEAIDELTIDAGAVIVPQQYITTLPEKLRPEDLQPATITLLSGGHPHPTSESVSSARRLMDLSGEATEDDVVIVLISGGGSALFADFADGITLEDAVRLNDLLLGSGASIDEVNTVRKHISRVSGGRLAAAIHPARSLSLAISDVRGNDPSVISSGPTVADGSTFEDAMAVITARGLVDVIPEPVRKHLQAGLRGEVEETLKAGDTRLERASYHLIANNRDALESAAEAASSLGCDVIVEHQELEGEASDVGRSLGQRLARLRVERPTCLLYGGETTVTLAPQHGTGGRNQELALAAALELEASSGACLLLAAGTDGIDGPTTAAGGIVDNQTARRARETGINLHDALRSNDANPALRKLDALFVTGPTHTNVMDIVVGLKLPDEAAFQRPD